MELILEWWRKVKISDEIFVFLVSQCQSEREELMGTNKRDSQEEQETEADIPSSVSDPAMPAPV